MISIKNVTKEFSGQKVLDGIDIDIEKGEVVALVGASGAGKSTILRCLNYLEQPDSGTIAIDDFKVDFGTITKEQILTLRRKLAMVFQQFNLFPNMTVKENITLSPIKTKGVSKADAEAKAMELLEKVGLKDKADAYPTSLSGGQQQRIAIARGLAMDPDVL
ncbi:MAG: amino acid ABC transporter ATP-binding protein, partial [Streptococcus sp.]